MSSLLSKLNHALAGVEKPGRYTGGEVNSVLKDRVDVRVSALLAFPDVYDVGMSYHGFKILYERINDVPHWSAERAYAPWPDMEQLMRSHKIPLYSLESKLKALQFDVVGFTLQHEVNYTNVLNMIDLSGAPLESADRPGLFPLFIAGGEGAMSPEPLAPFLDLFVLGDGEQTMLDLMALIEVFKESASEDKADLLRLASYIPGVYVPSLCECRYGEDGRIESFVDLRGDAQTHQFPLRRSQPFDLRADEGSTRPVIPNLRVIHDRLSIEIKRGCSRGCRFCAAGMINRPVRERTPEQILEIARKGLGSTGFDEISLLSLSSADYSCILPTVRMLQEAFRQERVSISLPSLRINSFDVTLADELAQVRKSGFTFAPEAGSERLRAVINKPLDEESFLSIVEEVCRKGWKTLKFYFMIGLPTETDEDLDGIVSLVKRAEEVACRRWGNAVQINVGLSPFVPKPHTPFQWAAQMTSEELDRRHRYVASRLRSKRISIKGHDRRLSFIEAVLARGDRRLAPAIRRAWELGAKFDGWDEHFKFDAWLRAFEETGIEPSFHANRERPLNEVLPWDHIHAGPGRDFLAKEWKLARGERTVPDCATVGCVGCEGCDEGIGHVLAANEWTAPEHLLAPAERPVVAKRRRNEPPVSPQDISGQKRLRFIFSRCGALRFLSHLDVVKVLQLACTRAGLSPAYTEGFNPRPKMSFMPPLPLGYETQADVFDVVLTKAVDPDSAMKRLNEELPRGMCILQASAIDLHADGPEAILQSAEYLVFLPNSVTQDLALDEKGIIGDLKNFADAAEVTFEKPATDKRPARRMNLKQTLLGVSEVKTDSQGVSLTLKISHRSGCYCDPLTCLGALTGKFLRDRAEIQVRRMRCSFS